MSSDMALRLSGLLKVTIPTPSVTLCRILPSAKDFSVLLGTSSIGALSGVGVIDMNRIETSVRHRGNGDLLLSRSCALLRGGPGWGSLNEHRVRGGHPHPPRFARRPPPQALRPSRV